MGKIIAINGKGGTGKSTVAALLVARLSALSGSSVLAIDADPNSCLAGMLGYPDAQTIVGVCDDVASEKDRLPPGVTKERLIEMRVQETISEADGFDLLVMGRPEGPGCYCYVNNLLRDIIARITRSYDYIVIDNAAGMEHISRRTTGVIDELVLVSDPSANGLRSTDRIYGLARSMKIKIARAWLVVNRALAGTSGLEGEVARTGLALAGQIPYSEHIARWSLADRPIFELEDPLVAGKIGEILKLLTEKKDADRACKGKV